MWEWDTDVECALVKYLLLFLHVSSEGLISRALEIGGCWCEAGRVFPNGTRPVLACVRPHTKAGVQQL